MHMLLYCVQEGGGVQWQLAFSCAKAAVLGEAVKGTPCIERNFMGQDSQLQHRQRGKGKGHPITGHEGPEGEQRYSYTL